MNDKEVWNKTLGYLSRRACSRHQLAAKLAFYGAAPEQVEKACRKAASLKLQDDASYARILVQREQRAGSGSIKIVHRLRSHGLPADIIKAATLQAAAEDAGGELERAGEAVRKALRGRPGLDRRGRYRYLIRKGFSGYTARAAASALRETPAVSLSDVSGGASGEEPIDDLDAA